MLSVCYGRPTSMIFQSCRSKLTRHIFFDSKRGLSDLLGYREALVVHCPDRHPIMCVQIDKAWECGHVGFFTVRWCPYIGQTCKGTKAVHEVLKVAGVCGDCVARARDPNPQPVNSSTGRSSASSSSASTSSSSTQVLATSKSRKTREAGA